MAIIRCPECGHAISDKAPVCPSCGVEIAGRVITCPQCGVTYFKNQPECPNCHHLTAQVPNALTRTTPPPAPSQAEQAAMRQNAPEVPKQTANEQSGQALHQTASQHSENAQAASQQNAMRQAIQQEEQEVEKKSNKRVIIISLIIAIIAVGVCFAFYSTARNDKETEAYEYAMNSKDPMVLQSYLDTYKDAPEEHIDSIQAHLDMLKQIDQDWTNACVSGSKSALEQYIQQHPDSPFKAQAMHKIDSIDWATAQATNTVEAFESYLEQHPAGDYADQANDNIKGLNTKTVQPEEKLMVGTAFRNFFSSLNAKDEDMLTSSVSQLMTSFLGKADATRSDVVTFMHKIYKPTVSSMTWASLGDYKISKKEIGDEQYEYTVDFSATQVVENTDGTETKNKYRIKAKLNPDSQITELNMTKILE